MGRIIATRLARGGTTVHALDRDADALELLAKEVPGIEIHPVDVTDAAALDAVLAPLAPAVDLVVTAAAIGHTGRLVTTPFETFERLARINYLGTVATIAPVLPAMVAAGRGRIVVFASMAGWIPAPAHGPYNAMKAALVMYSEVLRGEVGPAGVTVHCVCPPAVATPLLDDMPAAKDALGLVKAMRPEAVVDAIEKGVARGSFWILPDVPSKVMWRVRRHTPRLLDAAIRRMIKA
jgi:short-subunit dehydrogenase